jgi:uncharacterized membrane protein (DUF106 family)
MVDGMYGILNAVFGPVMGMQPMLSLIAVSVAVTFVITLLYRFLSNPKKMKELKDRAKELSTKTKELQKTNPDEAKKMTNEMLEITNKQMMASMKPMLATLLIAALFLPWMAAQFTGPIVRLPADVPYFGADLGWLMWYIIVSIPASQILRKLLGVDL